MWLKLFAGWFDGAIAAMSLGRKSLCRSAAGTCPSSTTLVSRGQYIVVGASVVLDVSGRGVVAVLVFTSCDSIQTR